MEWNRAELKGRAWNTLKTFYWKSVLVAFVLDLSFILWFILAAITFNLVGIFWVKPYYEFTCAELYKTLGAKIQRPYGAGASESFEA